MDEERISIDEQVKEAREHLRLCVENGDTAEDTLRAAFLQAAYTTREGIEEGLEVTQRVIDDDDEDEAVRAKARIHAGVIEFILEQLTKLPVPPAEIETVVV